LATNGETKIGRALGWVLLLLGLASNKWVLGRILSPHGAISSVTLNATILLSQCILIASGILLLMRRPRIVLSRRSIGVLLVILFSLYTSARLFLAQAWFLDSLLKSGIQRDDITRYEERFDALRKLLPPSGAVGYTTSPEIRADWATFYYHYYLTQYTLAPLIVDDSIRHELVIGNFPDSQPQSDVVPGLTRVADCGSGILLFRGHTDR
jgi:hypothetical protein